VIFKSYGDFSLNIMLYYFFEVADWTEELLAKEDINLKILTLAKELGVEFAFPTQTVHLESSQGQNIHKSLDPLPT
jgi:MscS family membrane protein